jgi:ankyrin repeat protein
LKAEPSLLNEQDEEGYTPLHLSVIAGNAAIVKFLISQGADINAVDNEMHSAVHWATGQTRFFVVLLLFLLPNPPEAIIT